MTCPKGSTHTLYGSDAGYVTGRHIKMQAPARHAENTRALANRRGHLVLFNMTKHDPSERYLQHAQRIGPTSVKAHRWIIVAFIWRCGPQHTEPETRFWLADSRDKAVRQVNGCANKYHEGFEGLYAHAQSLVSSMRAARAAQD